MSTIVTRAGKGSALTHNEVDANFTNLNTDKLQSGNTAASLIITSLSGTTVTYTNANISSATISGGTITGITDLSVADGGTGSSSASGARTNLGATTIGSNLFTLTNPGAITFPRFNADNTVSSLSAADFKTAIGTGSGTVTSVAATVPSFLSVSGSPITTSGTLAISYSGTALPVANGGTGITSFGSGVATWLGTPSSANLAAAVTDETGSGALVFGTSPTLTTPNINSAQVATVSGTAPLYMCRAWVNFNGTGTVAIRASGNVTSITDNGTGDYTVNFSTAFADINYASFFASDGTNPVATANESDATTRTVSAIRMLTGTSTTGALADRLRVSVSIFR